MKRMMTLLVAAVLALTISNFAMAQKTKNMKIVSFTGQVQIKLKDGSIIGVVPGAPVPDIPEGAEVIVVSGKAVFEAGGTVVTAAKGDSFAFTTSGNTVEVAATGTNTNIKVAVGKTEATVTSGSAVSVATTGKTATLSAKTGSITVTSGGQTTTLAQGQTATADTGAPATTQPATQISNDDPDTESETESPTGSDTGSDTGTGDNANANSELAPADAVSPSSP